MHKSLNLQWIHISCHRLLRDTIQQATSKSFLLISFHLHLIAYYVSSMRSNHVLLKCKKTTLWYGLMTLKPLSALWYNLKKCSLQASSFCLPFPDFHHPVNQWHHFSKRKSTFYLVKGTWISILYMWDIAVCQACNSVHCEPLKDVKSVC